MTNKLIIWLTFTIFLYACNETSENTSNNQNESFDTISIKLDKVFNQLVATGQFNGSILVYRDDSIIYDNYFGYADIENKKSLSSNSRYKIMSIEKTFVSMAIMLLKKENKLDYDDPISKHLTDFPYPDITIRQALTHTSGFPDVYRDMEKYKSTYWDTMATIGNNEIYDFIINYRPELNFPSGQSFRYSNINYLLLERIIARISGKSCEDYLQANIFDLIDTSPYKVSAEHIAKGHEFSYDTYSYTTKINSLTHHFMNGREDESNPPYFATHDFVKWHEALMEEKLVSKELLNEAFAAVVPGDSTVTNYGFGWGVIYDTLYGTKAFHYGGGGGYMTYFSHFPDKDIAVVLLSNKATNGSSGLTRVIENILFDQPFETPKISLAEQMRTGLAIQCIDTLINQFKVNYKDTATYSYTEYHTLKIAQALFNKDLPEDGWKVFHLVLELNPRSVYAHNFIGEWNMIMDDYDMAVKYFNKTLELDPKNDFAKENLRLIKEKQTMPNKK